MLNIWYAIGQSSNMARVKVFVKNAGHLYRAGKWEFPYNPLTNEFGAASFELGQAHSEMGFYQAIQFASLVAEDSIFITTLPEIRDWLKKHNATPAVHDLRVARYVSLDVARETYGYQAFNVYDMFGAIVDAVVVPYEVQRDVYPFEVNITPRRMPLPTLPPEGCDLFYGLLD